MNSKLNMDRTFVILISLILIVNTLYAVEPAKRISDKEIIESLAELKADNKNFDKRFESIDKRFESIDKRFESIDRRFESIDKRFESIEEKIERLRSDLIDLFKWGFGVMLSGMFILIGFVLWDRRSTIKPIASEVRQLEEEVNKIPKIIKVCRQLAKQNENFATAMKNVGLL